MAYKTHESSTQDSQSLTEHLSELKDFIQQLRHLVQHCQQRCPDLSEAREVKQEVAALLDALKVRCLLPYDAQALERPKDICACSLCGTALLVAQTTPVTRKPSGTQGNACPICASRRTNCLWYA